MVGAHLVAATVLDEEDKSEVDAWTPERYLDTGATTLSPNISPHMGHAKRPRPMPGLKRIGMRVMKHRQWNSCKTPENTLQHAQGPFQASRGCVQIAIARQSYGISSTAQPWEATREDDPLQPQIGKHEGVVHIQCSISSPEHCVSWCVLRVCSQRYNSRPQGFATETHASGLTPIRGVITNGRSPPCGRSL